MKSHDQDLNDTIDELTARKAELDSQAHELRETEKEREKVTKSLSRLEQLKKENAEYDPVAAGKAMAEKAKSKNPVAFQ